MKNAIAEHFNLVIGLVALLMIIGALLTLILHGMKDETVVAILATGSVGIAQAISGVQKPTSGQQQPQIPQLPQVSQLPQQPQAPVTPSPGSSEVLPK